MSGMRIAYCVNVRLPSERAHAHQVAQVCDALVQLGHDVTIFCPFRKSAIASPFSQHYGVDHRVRCVTLGSFDPIDAWWLPKIAQLWVLNGLLKQHIHHRLSSTSFDLVYTRTPALLATLLRHHTPVILELHQVPHYGLSRFARLCNRSALVACLTSPMRKQLIDAGVAPNRVIVAPDAVSIHRFANLPTRKEAQARLGISTDRLVVGYVGRLKTLGKEKGVGTLLLALQSLSEGKAYFGLIVGGPAEDQREYEAQAESLGLTPDDVRFTGAVPSSDVPAAMAACDILAMPFPDDPHYRSNMSPLKMFEYMATGNVIVTSDLPTIRDVLNEHTAVFCRPGSMESLAQALEWVRANRSVAEARGRAAKALAHEHTWTKRMARILDSLNRPLASASNADSRAGT